MSAETLGGASTPFSADDAAAQATEPSAQASASTEGLFSAEGFFSAEGDTLVPASFSTSPWGQVLHGRLIGGLTARAAEQARAADPELACSRAHRRHVPLRATEAGQGQHKPGTRRQAHRGA